jgi:BON domain
MSRDRSLELDIEAELESDPRVDANHLGVSVNHRAVTLSGVASSYSEKWAALQAAERVYGVQTIADQIQVRLPDADVQDDTKIAEAIERSFRTHTHIPSRLYGHVHSFHDRQAAEHAAFAAPRGHQRGQADHDPALTSERVSRRTRSLGGRAAWPAK